MNVTEAEAAKKFCPHIRTIGLNGGGSGCGGTGGGGTGGGGGGSMMMARVCIGSQCMMWVWDYEKDEFCNKVQSETGHCGLIK